MTKIYRKLALFAYLLVASLTMHAQSIKEIQSAFDVNHQNLFEEKIFVHTDKEQYLAGEILWFKVYNVDAFTLLPADLSKVVYVEVLDLANRPVMQAKVSLKNGNGSGSMYIPSNVTNGNYKFRSYTNWMKNFGPNHFFEKQITLLNPLNAPEKKKNNPVGLDIQFFAEGGELIQGISCNVGFKALSANGTGITVKGVIINQKNDTVARFQSLKFGIGQFKFMPLANQTYTAIASTNQKEILIKPLPQAKHEGYALYLEDSENESLNVNVGTNLMMEKVHLLVHQGNKTTVATTTSLKAGKAVFQINKDKLADGLSHFTLFNEAGKAVAERLYFKRPSKKLIVSAYSDLLIYKGRQKVNVSIQTTNEKKEPIAADISIAIKRLDSLQLMDQSDIVSYFWLSSELKGNIEKPNYYFHNPTKESDKALDNLLLTQGWRRMILDNEANKSLKPKFLPEFNGHLVSGNVKNNSLKSTSVYLTLSQANQQFYNSTSDSSGNFIFNTKDFYGLNEIIVQTNPNTDTTSIITIQSPFSEKHAPFDFPVFEINPALFNVLESHSFGMQVRNIYVADQLKKIIARIIDTTKFYGEPAKSYNLDDYTRFTTMEEVLREYVRETFISKKDKHFVINILGKTDLLQEQPLVLVDGAPYFNMDRVMEIDPTKIKKLEVIKDSYLYGSTYYDGILNFTSYKPNATALEINPNALVIDYEGMQLQREFYSPSYETPEKKKDRIPDYRSLLFWSPSTFVDEKGDRKLSFYTSDQPGTYVGVLNGLSSTGTPGTTTFTFDVK